MSQPAIRQPISVGKYFLERGKISPQQLDLALKHRAEFGLKLGQSLVELGFVTEADMVEALRYQARFPCIHLTSGIVETKVANKLAEEVSRRLRAIALNQIAGHTTIALEDPSDAAALEELGHILGTRIFPVYAEPSAIRNQIDQVYGSKKPKTKPASPAEARDASAAADGTGVPGGAAVAGAHEGPATVPAELSAEDREAVERVRGFLQKAFELGVSDIHLESRREELSVRFRSGGVLREHARLPGPQARPAIACLKALAKLPDGATGVPREATIPFTFKKQHYQVRLALTPSLHGESAVLHVLGSEHPRRELDQLGLEAEQLAELEQILVAPSGLVFVNGPVRSGRSSTLHAMLARLGNPNKKLVALGAHVENEIEGVLHVQVDPRAGFDYAFGSRAVLSQDPDVLLVDEVDGPETARCLLEAALSGRLVLSSLRTGGALDALARLVHLGLEPYLLADALRGVVAQRLVRRICAECKAPSVPDEVLRASLGLPKDGTTFYEGEGCATCLNSGYHGRIGLFELLGVTPGLRRELEKGSDLEALSRAARGEGFVSLRELGLRQARAGVTTLHEILAATAGAS